MRWVYAHQRLRFSASHQKVFAYPGILVRNVWASPKTPDPRPPLLALLLLADFVRRRARTKHSNWEPGPFERLVVECFPCLADSVKPPWH
jgi:hypothetical protein